jgi:DNA-binding response OmpR family regulator
VKALIVCRSPQARAWVRGALDPAWEISEALDGNEALRAAKDEALDLVVADESTEPFGAFGLARELKILDDPPAIVVLLERAQDQWLAKWSGADRWFVQPVDPFALSDAAREITAKQTAV